MDDQLARVPSSGGPPSFPALSAAYRSYCVCLDVGSSIFLLARLDVLPSLALCSDRPLWRPLGWKSFAIQGPLPLLGPNRVSSRDLSGYLLLACPQNQQLQVGPQGPVREDAQEPVVFGND